MINDESDIRAWVREASGGAARWVEPGLGSTNGLPDCWVPWQGYCVHLELKLGKLNKQGILKYTVRPEQKRALLGMLDNGVPAGLVVGVKGGSSVIFMLINPKNLNGHVWLGDHEHALTWLGQDIRNKGDFLSGVNFIFSDSVKMG